MSIDSLDSDLLIYILSFLPMKTWFKIESVNKKWQKCVRKLMDTKITKFGPKELGEIGVFTPTAGYGFVISNNHLQVTKNILLRCQSVKYLKFSNYAICSSNNLLEIAKLCPKLERINLNNSVIEISPNEWEQFAQIVGSKLTKCNINLRKTEESDFCYFQDYDTEEWEYPFDYDYCDKRSWILLKQLFSQFDKIESLEFSPFDNSHFNIDLFGYLNSCKNLKSLKWIDTSCSDYHIEGREMMVNVFQRLEYLKTNLPIFCYINCKMDNLTELFLCGGQPWSGEMDTIEYPNLEKLSFEFDSDYTKHISKLKFPKLEYLGLQKFLTEINPEDKTILKLLKNVKKIYLGYGLKIDNLILLTNLTNVIELTVYFVIGEQFEMFDIIQNHETIEKLTIERTIQFYLNDSKFIGFCNRLISLGETKPNLRISLRMDINKFCHENQFVKFINEHKRKFHLSNWKVMTNRYNNYVIFTLKK